jgi:hypothetical protein
LFDEVEEVSTCLPARVGGLVVVSLDIADDIMQVVTLLYQRCDFGFDLVDFPFQGDGLRIIIGADRQLVCQRLFEVTRDQGGGSTAVAVPPGFFKIPQRKRSVWVANLGALFVSSTPFLLKIRTPTAGWCARRPRRPRPGRPVPPAGFPGVSAWSRPRLGLSAMPRPLGRH